MCFGIQEGGKEMLNWAAAKKDDACRVLSLEMLQNLNMKSAFFDNVDEEV